MVVSNEFVVNGLNVYTLLIEIRVDDFVSNFLKMEWFVFTIEDEVDFVAQCAWIDVSPFFESNAFFDEFGSFPNFHGGYNECFAYVFCHF